MLWTQKGGVNIWPGPSPPPLGELAAPFVTSQWAIHGAQEPTSFPQPCVNARQKVQSCLRLFQGLQHLAEGTRATFPDLFVLAKTSR